MSLDIKYVKSSFMFEGKEYLLFTEQQSEVNKIWKSLVGDETAEYVTRLFLVRKGCTSNFHIVLFCKTYQTEEEAVEEHKKLLAKLKRGEKIW